VSFIQAWSVVQGPSTIVLQKRRNPRKCQVLKEAFTDRVTTFNQTFKVQKRAMARIGYHASHEQFAPANLLCWTKRRGGWLRLRNVARPLPSLERSGWAAATELH
jgi:hypothetical protein